MSTYLYSYHDERGEFRASVSDEMGNTIWSVNYPEYYEDDETGELMESTTIFDDGFMKHAKDVDGLSNYLNSLGLISDDDVIVSEDELQEGETTSHHGFMKSGGRIETAMKKRLKKTYELPMEMVVYVPSTEKANRPIPKRDFINRIEETQEFLANTFGGFSAGEVEGGYVSTEKGLIQEDVVKVAAFGNLKNFEANFEKLIEKIKYWVDRWEQESIGFEFEGDLFYIDKNTEFRLGGVYNVKNQKVGDGEEKMAYRGYHLPEDMYEVFVKAVTPNKEHKFLKSVVSARSFEQAEDLAMSRLNRKYPDFEFEIMDVELAEAVMKGGGETKTTYEDAHVSAKIGVENNYVDILTWNPKQSYSDSILGLKDLNEKYSDKRIIAVDVDDYPSAEYKFWYEMLEDGLIYGFTDEYDRLHTSQMKKGGAINYEGYYYGGGRLGSERMDYGGMIENAMRNKQVAEHFKSRVSELKSGAPETINITYYFEERYYPAKRFGEFVFADDKLYYGLRDENGNLKEGAEEIDENVNAYFDYEEIKKFSGKELHDMWKSGKGISVEKKEKENKKKPWWSFEDGGMMAKGGELEREINELYSKSNFINNDFNWELKLLEMLQDGSVEAYNIYQTLTKEQKEQVLQEQFEMDNDMGSYGDGDIETSKENIEILLEDAQNGKKYAKGGVIASSTTKSGIEQLISDYYISPNISLHQRGEGNEFDVHNKKGKINGVKVIEKRGRYQFVSDEKMEKGGRVEYVLWGTKVGNQDWEEELLATKPYEFEITPKLLELTKRDGYDRLRIAKIDLSTPPDFTKTLNKERGGEFGVDKHRTYFRTFGEVMDAIHDIAKDNGYNIVDIFPDLSYGGVGYGQTRRGWAELEWNGEEKRGKSKKRDKNTLVINIYRMDSGSYELNTYFSYADGGMTDTDEIQIGDYVNFGEYGNFYVVNTDYLREGTNFWVTRDKEDRTNSNAQGYSIFKSDAKYIIEKYKDADDSIIADGDYMAKGGKTKKYADWVDKKNELEKEISKLEKSIDADYSDREVTKLTKEKWEKLDDKKEELKRHLKSGQSMAKGGAVEKKYFMTVSFEQRQKYGNYGLNRKSVSVRAKNTTEAISKAKKFVKERLKGGMPIKNMVVIHDTIVVDEIKYSSGGDVTFVDKVASVKKSLLERKKVPKAVQKDYGKTFSPEEAEDSAKRIVGAQTYAERINYLAKKGNKKLGKGGNKPQKRVILAQTLKKLKTKN